MKRLSPITISLSIVVCALLIVFMVQQISRHVSEQQPSRQMLMHQADEQTSAKYAKQIRAAQNHNFGAALKYFNLLREKEKITDPIKRREIDGEIRQAQEDLKHPQRPAPPDMSAFSPK